MFIIKTHYVATEANKNFAGEEQTWYSGKKGHTLSKNEMPAQLGHGSRNISPIRLIMTRVLGLLQSIEID